MNKKIIEANFFKPLGKKMQDPQSYAEAARFLRLILDLENKEISKVIVHSPYRPYGLLKSVFSIPKATYSYLETLNDVIPEHYNPVSNAICISYKNGKVETYALVHEAVHYLAKNQHIFPFGDTFLARAVQIFYMKLKNQTIDFENREYYSKFCFDLGQEFLTNKNKRSQKFNEALSAMKKILDQKDSLNYLPQNKTSQRLAIVKGAPENYDLGMFVGGTAIQMNAKWGFRAAVLFFRSLAKGQTLDEAIAIAKKNKKLLTQSYPEFKQM
jgi:hypothetical protein